MKADTTAAEELTGAQSLVKSLEQVGADTVFGIPGGAILPGRTIDQNTTCGSATAATRPGMPLGPPAAAITSAAPQPGTTARATTRSRRSGPGDGSGCPRAGMLTAAHAAPAA